MLGEHRGHCYQGTNWADTATRARIFWTTLPTISMVTWAK